MPCGIDLGPVFRWYERGWGHRPVRGLLGVRSGVRTAWCRCGVCPNQGLAPNLGAPAQTPLCYHKTRKIALALSFSAKESNHPDTTVQAASRDGVS